MDCPRPVARIGKTGVLSFRQVANESLDKFTEVSIFPISNRWCGLTLPSDTLFEVTLTGPNDNRFPIGRVTRSADLAREFGREVATFPRLATSVPADACESDSRSTGRHDSRCCRSRDYPTACSGGQAVRCRGSSTRSPEPEIPARMTDFLLSEPRGRNSARCGHRVETMVDRACQSRESLARAFRSPAHSTNEGRLR